MNNKKTVRQLVQEILIQNQNSSLSAKDVYDLISNPEVVDELGEITEHPTYGKHTLGFNSIRNALHNLYLENWFNADKNFDGTRNTYYNIYTPYSVETFEHSTNVIEDEYQRYLTTYNKTDNRPKQNVEINNDEYDDNETCSGANCSNCQCKNVISEYSSDDCTSSDTTDVNNESISDEAKDISLSTLVTLIISELLGSTGEFSAYDVTKEARSYVNSGIFTVDGGSLNINHDDVKFYVKELIDVGVFDVYKCYVKDGNKSYTLYYSL